VFVLFRFVPFCSVFFVSCFFSFILFVVVLCLGCCRSSWRCLLLPAFVSSCRLGCLCLLLPPLSLVLPLSKSCPCLRLRLRFGLCLVLPLSSFVLCLVLSVPNHVFIVSWSFVLSYALSCFVWSGLVLSCLVLFCLCLILSYSLSSLLYGRSPCGMQCEASFAANRG
jgi:hypothetical protein